MSFVIPTPPLAEERLQTALGVVERESFEYSNATIDLTAYLKPMAVDTDSSPQQQRFGMTNLKSLSGE